ncbi:MAG: hypothetical protein ACI9Y8_001330 [Candidatus Omnitrophota bacterium]|jgi:hypothetical protein
MLNLDRPRTKVKLLSFIMTLGVLCVSSDGLAVRGLRYDYWQADNERLAKMKVFHIVEPRFYHGNKANNNALKDLVDMDMHIIAGIREGALSALSKKGYVCLWKDNLFSRRKDGQALELADLWSDVTRFSNAAKNQKKSLYPYSIDPLYKLVGNSEPHTNALVFVQLYSKSRSNMSQSDRLHKEVASNALINAVSVSALGMMAVTSSSLSKVDYKISIYNTLQGDLLWYQEGFSSTSNIHDPIRMETLIATILSRLPEAVIPQRLSKFKRKRSG